MYTDATSLQQLSKDELISLIQSDTNKTQSIRNLLNNINGVSWEYDISQDKFTCVSPTTEKILGYTVEEWTDLNSWVKMLHPDDKEHVVDYCGTQTKDGKDHIMEYKMLKKNGDVIWVLDIVTLAKDSQNNPEKLYGFILNITDSKEAQLKLEEEHKFLQTIIDAMPNPMMIINSDYSVSHMNEARREDLKGRTFLDDKSPKCYEISHYRDTPCESGSHPCPLADVLQTKKPVKVIHNHKTLSGNNHFVELAATPIFDKNNNCTGIIESAIDITEHVNLRKELQEKNENLTFQAYHDPLTKLPNRALFMDRLQQNIKDAKRNSQNVTLFFMDLDHFKAVNDSYGHNVGDRVLQEVSKRFLACTRENDTLARLSGDEFTLLLKNSKNKEDIKLIAQKIITTINEPIFIDTYTIKLSTSIGISTYPQDTKHTGELLLYADAAMYKAKEQGKNSFSFYSEVLNSF